MNKRIRKWIIAAVLITAWFGLVWIVGKVKGQN